MTSPSPRSTSTTRLAELAAPTRGRPRYAPLTAGLLARKGEAQPASPLFAAEALGLSPQLTTGARPQLPPPELDAQAMGEEPEPDIREALRPWRTRKLEPNGFDHAAEAKAQAHPRHAHSQSNPSEHVAYEPRARIAEQQGAEREGRASLTLDLDLETLARLALEARKRASTPARIIEQALGQHLPATGACPLCDSFHVAP